MRHTIRAVLNATRKVATKIVEPLRKNSDSPSFTLSIPETQTTTVDGGIGWAQRPAAVLICPRCGSHVRQSDPRERIDCPRCVAEFDYTEFTELELEALICPVCGDRMEHGQRHPHALDVPEWATCTGCRYHWEFKHSFP